MTERLTMQEVIDHCNTTVFQAEALGWTDTKPYMEHKQVREWLKELQYYKNLEAQGRLIILPEDEGKVQAMNEKLLELTSIAEEALKENCNNV